MTDYLDAAAIGKPVADAPLTVRCSQCHGATPVAHAARDGAFLYCDVCRPPAPPQVDARMLAFVAQSLVAMREQIDTALLALNVALGIDEEQPTDLASFDAAEECDHPRDRRESLAVIGGDNVDEWRCRDCGFHQT